MEVLEKEEEKVETGIEKLFRKSPKKKRSLQEINLFFCLTEFFYFNLMLEDGIKKTKNKNARIMPMH